jgi:hypothetical protein
MLMVRKTGTAWRRGLSALCAMASAVALGGTSTLVELDRGEPFEAMVVQGNHLWVGHSRSRFNADYRVQVFDGAGAKVAEAPLKHAVSFLYAHDANAVLAVGTANTPNLTQYSLLWLSNGKLQVRTMEVPEYAWAHQWLGTFGGAEHFLDFSGNTDDPEGDENFNLPRQTIFSMSGRRAKYLPIRLRAPVMGKKVGNLAYVIRAYALGQPARNLVRVDFAKREAKDLCVEPLNRARDFVAQDGGKTLAVSIQGDEVLRYVDATTGGTLAEVKVDGGPSSVAELGQCVLVGAEAKKEVVAVRRNAEGKAEVALRVDMGGTGKVFRGLRKIAVNPTTGAVYGRSAYACNPLAEDCSQLWNSVAVTDADTSASLLKACN